jgi:hypothetical protein
LFHVKRSERRAREVKLTWRGRPAPPAASPAPSPPRNAWTTSNRSGWLLEGDNLAGLAESHAGHVTLAYLDPPFFTNREHHAWLRKAETRARRTRVHAFDDRWADLPAYLSALNARLEVVRPLLAPHGSIVVHVDPKTSHYVRVLGDEIFGTDAFASEIVWRYRALAEQDAQLPAGARRAAALEQGPVGDAAVEPALRTARGVDARDMGHEQAARRLRRRRAAHAFVVNRPRPLRARALAIRRRSRRRCLSASSRRYRTKAIWCSIRTRGVARRSSWRTGRGARFSVSTRAPWRCAPALAFLLDARSAPCGRCLTGVFSRPVERFT